MTERSPLERLAEMFYDWQTGTTGGFETSIYRENWVRGTARVLEYAGIDLDSGPDWEYGATHVDPERPVTVVDSVERVLESQNFYDREIARHSDGRYASNVFRRTKAVPAGPWEPIPAEVIAEARRTGAAVINE